MLWRHISPPAGEYMRKIFIKMFCTTNYKRERGNIMNLLKNNMKILFQGDSVTDNGRNREDLYDLGVGYPKYIAQALNNKYENITVINKGISGDRTQDLVRRWKEDCLDIKPDLVSILIGINDTWRRFDLNEVTSEIEFEENYTYLLNEIKEKLNVPIIMIDPFIVTEREDQTRWRVDLDPKIQIIRKLAAKFGAYYIPIDSIFAAACCSTTSKFWEDGKYTARFAQQKDNESIYEFWAGDGVHPSNNGHKFIAYQWLKHII